MGLGGGAGNGCDIVLHVIKYTNGDPSTWIIACKLVPAVTMA